MKRLFLLLILILITTSCQNADSKINVQDNTSGIPTNNEEKSGDDTSSNNSKKDETIIDNSEIDKDTIKENIEIKIEPVQQEKYLELKFYSPDRKNYIFATTDFESEGIYSFYLNSKEEYLDSVSLFFEFDNNSINWLDNNRVLISGIFIYDIKTKTKEYIDYSALNVQEDDDNEYLYRNSSINYFNDKIAYVFLKGREEYIYIYDIPSKKWSYVWNKFKLIDYYGFDVIWDKNDNLYFDSWGFVLDENNDIVESRDVYTHIHQYTYVDNKTILLLDKYSIHSASLDYKYILLEDAEGFPNPYYYIYDLNKQEIIYEMEENSIYSICWSNDSKYITYYDNKKKAIYIYSLVSQKTYEHKIDDILGDGYFMELNPEDDYFIFVTESKDGKIKSYKITLDDVENSN